MWVIRMIQMILHILVLLEGMVLVLLVLALLVLVLVELFLFVGQKIKIHDSMI